MNFLIKTYTPPQLLEFINSEEFKHLENYPITRHRALSHINNPRSNDTDKILYIAFQNNAIIGYRLIMVDAIRVEENNEKIGWYSGVWVDPKKRGQGIAKKLVELSLKDWNNNIIFQGPVVASKNLYTHTTLFNEVFITGLRAYARFDFEHVAAAKAPSLKPFSFIFKTTDRFLNFFVDSFSTPKKCPDRVQLVDEVDDEIVNLLQQHQSTNLFKREKIDFNWILKYPWVLSSDKVDPVSKRYYFSSIAKKFKLINAKFYNENKKMTGFVMFQIRDQHLSIQTAYFEPSQTKAIIDFTYYLIREHKVNFFSVYHQQLVKHIQTHPHPFIFTKTLRRGFYYSKNLAHYFKKNPQLSFEAGDGDMIFT